MLGLNPLLLCMLLEATITGVLDRGDYVVEKLHFQSVPGAARHRQPLSAGKSP